MAMRLLPAQTQAALLALSRPGSALCAALLWRGLPFLKLRCAASRSALKWQPQPCACLRLATACARGAAREAWQARHACAA
eukprot:2095683-Pleurochrysis_carterae.AAC.1